MEVPPFSKLTHVQFCYHFNELVTQEEFKSLKRPGVWYGICVVIQIKKEIVKFQVSSMEMVQEIYQVLIDHTDTCHRTCFSLQLNNTTLDNFAELKTIDLKEGSVVKVVEGI